MCSGASSEPYLGVGLNTTKFVIPNFKDKIGYTPYASLRSQISHIATNEG